MRNSRWWRYRHILLSVVAALMMLISFVMMLRSGGDVDERPLSTVMAMAEAGSVEEIKVDGDRLTVHLKDGIGGETSDTVTAYTGGTVNMVDFIQALEDSGAEVGPGGIEVTTDGPGFWGNPVVQAIVGLIPLAIFLSVYLYFIRSSLGMGLRTKVKRSDLPKVTFRDIAGSEEAKTELHEIVEFFRSPDKFTALGARVPKGVLLVGEPGTGKTLLARAVAGESNVPFFYMSGSAFVEMFVGLAASRMRNLFKEAKKVAPAVIFIDEIDAIGGKRGTGGGAGEADQAVNQMLTEMDGFYPQSHPVVVIAATNRPETLDSALTRPGRFDRRVPLDLPDERERRAILDIHAADKPLALDASLDSVAWRTGGASGAVLANILNEAAIISARQGFEAIPMRVLDDAIEKTYLGAERLSRSFSIEDQEVIAYHEAGHAVLCRLLLPDFIVHTISIIPRGVTGGHVTFFPTDQRLMPFMSEQTDVLTVAVGGRAAEDIVFDDVTFGGCSDFETADDRAQQMLQRGIGGNGAGPDGKHETGTILAEAYQRALSLIADNRGALEWIAEYLLEHKQVSGEAVTQLFDEAWAAAGPSGERIC